MDSREEQRDANDGCTGVIGEAALILRKNQEPPQQRLLPPSLSVLFVDDDPILRKLLVRGVRAIAPDWGIQEAASGEAALRLVEESSPFDLIFMDQYMASMEKQLLGTETTHSLRCQGVRSKICGLSANDLADDFFAAGADVFICKPLPVKKDSLYQLLLDILFRSVPPSEMPPMHSAGAGQSSVVMFPP